jgi:hypothetical protein
VVALGVDRSSLRWLDDDGRHATLRFDGSRTEDRVQGERRVRVIWRALYPAPHPVKRTGNQRQRLARRDFCVEKAAIAAGAAVRRKLQIVVEDLLKGAVWIRFPDRAASTMGTLVKDRLASNRDSQIRPPQRRMREKPLDPLLPAEATMFPFMPVRRRLRNSKFVVKHAQNNVRRYYAASPG